MKIRPTLITIQVLLGILLFILLFYFQKIGMIDFWWWMSFNLILLISTGLILDREYMAIIFEDIRKRIIFKILVGLISVLFLYLIFYIGNILLNYLLPGASASIHNVYAFKGNASTARIALLMLLVIGPGEELFWRAYLQRRLSARWGRGAGFVVAAIIYTSVHLLTGNGVLVLSAMVCGLFWGWLFLKYQSPLLNVISHTLWDLAVFIVFPFSR